MPIFRLSKKEKRRVSVFAACVITAVAAWFFFALSAAYRFEVDARVSYVNVPAFKSVHPLQPGVVHVKMEGTGWHLLLSKFKPREYTIPVDLRQVAEKNFVTFTDQKGQINKEVRPAKIVSVSPDTLFFDFSESTVKKVPLLLASNVDFGKQYSVNGKIELTPNVVTLTGPAEQLEKISYWHTDSLIQKNVNKDIVSIINTKASGLLNINVFPASASLNFPVGEFTETTFEVPLKVFNNHEYEIKLLPQKVKIRCMVSLEHFKTINKNSFVAGVDFNQWLLQKYQELPVMLTKIPPFVKLIKYEPQTVDFIIKE